MGSPWNYSLAKAVIEAEDGILILHPSEIDANRNWHIPGGIRDDIQEPIDETARREVREETSIKLDDIKGSVFKTGEWLAVDQGEKVKILAVFFHFILPHRPKITLSSEHDEFTWIDRTSYRDYQANKEVYEIVEELLTPSS